jgi:alkylation response protein AidB-like acyl-CoA dehydrogenase
MESTHHNPIKGGEFIIRQTKPNEIFIPEEWNEEQQMIAQMCDDFITQEINPNIERIDKMEEGLMPSLLDKAGELGMLGMSVPEELGGMGVDFKTSLLATERLGKGLLFFCCLWCSHRNRNFTDLVLWNGRTKGKIHPQTSFRRMESSLLSY